MLLNTKTHLLSFIYKNNNPNKTTNRVLTISEWVREEGPKVHQEKESK